MTTYQYHPINGEEIRLLTLQSGHDSSVCFTTHNIAALPKFHALSYVWGAKDNPASVRIGSEYISITRNLAEALTFLPPGLLIWIDAVCINQGDVQERSQQVQLMHHIYSKADVIAFVGGEDTIAPDVVNLIYEHVQFDWTSWTWSGDDWLDRTRPSPLDVESWNALVHLLRRPWFSRMWIRQEVQLAKTLRLQSGPASVDWEKLRTAIAYIATGPSPGIGDYDTAEMRLGSIYELCKPRNTDLVDTIDAGRESDCSDDRDRVYAVLSIVNSPKTLSSLKPDYTKSVQEVYMDLVPTVASLYGSLNILEFVSPARLPDLPSWAPDWTTRTPTKTMTGVNAGLRLSSPPCRRDSHILAVKGKIIAKATEVWSFRAHYASYPLFEQDMRQLAASIPCDPDRLCKVLLLDDTPERVTHTNNSRPPMSLPTAHAVLRSILVRPRYPPTPLILLALTLQLLQSRGWLPRHWSLTSLHRRRDFIDQAMATCQGRTVVRAAGGELGLAPGGAEPGDVVAVVAGAPTPFLLRPQSGGRYALRGSAYFEGVMCGEALVGSLPPDWELVSRVCEDSHRRMGYRHKRTGDFQLDDPRLDETYQKGTEGHLGPRYDLSLLEERGAQLQWIELV